MTPTNKYLLQQKLVITTPLVRTSRIRIYSPTLFEINLAAMLFLHHEKKIAITSRVLSLKKTF